MVPITRQGSKADSQKDTEVGEYIDRDSGPNPHFLCIYLPCLCLGYIFLAYFMVYILIVYFLDLYLFYLLHGL